MLPYHSMDITNKTSHLRALTDDKVDECLNLASQFFNCSFYYVDIRYDLKGRTAGQLISKRALNGYKYSFRFNVGLLSRYQSEFIDQVTPHECAHLVAYQVYGRAIKPHGREWRYVMNEVFGVAPKVTHTFEVQPARTLRQFEYYCACSGRKHHLSTIRHNKILRSRARYLCRVCRTALKEGEKELTA